MSVKKRDFQRVVHDIKEFLCKLQGNETAELRDSLNYSLLNLHKYYKRLRHKTKITPLLDGSISLSSSLGSISPASPYIPPINKFEWRWINLDSSQLSSSFGHGDKRNLLPEIFYILKEGDVDALKKFVDKEPDSVNEVDVLGRSTVAYCIYGKTNEHLECLDFLIQHGADIQHEANDGILPIHLCGLCNNEKALDRLLAKKVNINKEDCEGRYPIHLAAGYADKTIVKKLLMSGCDKNALDNDEMTPVMWACHFDNYENMELLLNIASEDDMRFEIIDAELNDKDKMGKTLLHWSVSRTTSRQCFKVLFCNDYAINVDNEGKTALHHIAENGVVGALEEFFSIAEDTSTLDLVDHQGRTPLHLACLGGHGELVDILLNRGASIEINDKLGNTPFDYAKQRNLNYCILVILSHLKYRHRNQALSQPTPPTPTSLLHGQTSKQTVLQQQTYLDSKTPSKSADKQREKSPVANKRKTLKKQGKEMEYKEENKNKLSVPTMSKIRPANDDDYESRQRGDSYTTSFDTPQHEFESINTQHIPIDGFSRENDIEAVESESDKSNYSFNDQLVVLVQHQGSDDELVIDVDPGVGALNDNENNVIENSDNDIEEDGDLLDIPFARNGSITTVGVVSEGSMAFNSVTIDRSMSSLISSMGEDDEDSPRGRMQQPGTRRNTGKRNVENSSHDWSRGSGQPIQADYSPRLPSAPLDITAPIPPPSHYYDNRNAEVLVIDEGQEVPRIDQSVNMARPKTSKGRQNPNSANSKRQRSPNRMEQSWPPPSTSPSQLNYPNDEEHQRKTSAVMSTRNSSTVRLAPISLSALPKPPPFKFDD